MKKLPTVFLIKNSFLILFTAISTFCFPFITTAQTVTTTIDFEDVQPGVITANQYASKGVTFLKGTTFSASSSWLYPVIKKADISVGLVPRGYPHTYSNVADISVCPGGFACEAYFPVSGAQFDKSVQKVKVSIGLIDYVQGKSSVQLPVVLKVFDLNHKLISSNSASIAYGSRFDNILTCESASANIAYFEVSGPQFPYTHIGIDNLTFETPAAPLSPDFDLNGDQSIDLRQGATAELRFKVVRFNNSTGAVSFAVSQLPKGVSGHFSLTESIPGNTPEDIVVTITALPNADLSHAIPVPIKITGMPYEYAGTVGATKTFSNAGPGNKTLIVNLFVKQNFFLVLPGDKNVPLPADGEISIPFSVVRAYGFADNVSLNIAGLPPGVIGSFDQPVVGLPSGGNLANNVILKLKAGAGCVVNAAAVQIVATSGNLPQSIANFTLFTNFSTGELTKSEAGNARGCLLWNLTPQWVSVKPQDDPMVIEGVVFKSEEAGTDNMALHYTKDWNTFIEMDNKYASLNSPSNEQHEFTEYFDGVTGKTIPTHRALTLEMEWEKGYLPEKFRPKALDRVWMMGRWIYDCGHTPFQTEIHPPQAIASTRASTFKFAGDFKFGNANLCFIYVYGRATGLRSTTYYYSVAEKKLNKFAIDYEFDIYLPPKPSANSIIRTQIIEKPYGGPDPILTPDPANNKVHVRYPVGSFLRQSKYSKYGTVVVAGWRENF